MVLRTGKIVTLKKIVILCLFLYIMKNPHIDPQFFIKQHKKDTIYYEEINNYINVNIFCMYQWETMIKDSDLKPIDNE